MIKRVFNHFHFCCGLGGGAAGFNRSKPIVGNIQAEWNCLGGIDVDPAGLRDFERLTGVKGTLMDLFTRDQYTRFHGTEPPAGWKEATADDIRQAAQNQRPDAVFISSPCKGASGLLSEKMSLTPKYQALNELTLRCVWLMCEAWADDPVSLIVFENVPRLATRGRHLLDQIGQLLKSYGYAVAETTHDCGELGGLAQSRRRFLLVARHVEKVPPFLYEPIKRNLKAVGDVLGNMPMPGDLELAGPMHRVPSLQWKTWVRLALVEAGKDWRSLNRLNIEDGYLRDLVIVPEYHHGYLGVRDWAEPTGTVTGRSMPANGSFSVADPRMSPGASEFQQYGVRDWNKSTGTVSGQSAPGGGAYSVADPRTGVKHNNCFRVVEYDQHAGAVTAGTGPSAGGQAVADPRPKWENRHSGNYRIVPWDKAAGTIIAGGKGVQGGQQSVADPRPGINRGKGDSYLTGGHYGVVPWSNHSYAVAGAAKHDNGHWSVADPRLPAATERLTCVIRSTDNTWHRPFTTLELAALQSLIHPEDHWHFDSERQQWLPLFDGEPFAFGGASDSAWRERIGNAVPPDAAEAMADVFGTTLLLAEAGETFLLNSQPIWVRPVAVALSVAGASA